MPFTFGNVLSQKSDVWHTTALEAVHKVDLTGKTSVVTGGNSGIGVETVRALASAGSRVILTSRSVAAGETVAQELKASGVKGDIVVKQLDLSDLASVKAFSRDFLTKEKGPDLLILNAGVMGCPLEYTKEGFEMQIGTNHFGHFALTRDLLPSMRKLTGPAESVCGAWKQGTPARVVAVSSELHRKGALDLADLHYRERKYSGIASYGQSKLANILFAKELARREKGTNVKAYSLHPGVIHTRLTKHMLGEGLLKGIVGVVGSPWLKSPAQGAATSITAALDPALENQSGKPRAWAYLQDCHVKTPSKAADDMDMAKALWLETELQLGSAEAQLALK